MKREIKYRGMDIMTDEWVYGYAVFDGFAAYIVPIDKPFRKEPEIPQPMNWIEVDELSVGEFTGLLDKQDKEVYEDDVVVQEHWNGGDNMTEPSETYTFEGSVVWHCGGFGIQTPICEGEGTEVNLCKGDEYTKVEVIGNVHSNPELL